MNNCNGDILAVLHRSEPVAPGEKNRKKKRFATLSMFSPG